ncbi:MAG: hypothetical protein IVW57_11860, partial [Ktedonobacterales bacterium]|nr:hypothetical protein [Ktedonobacterales bacterium]
MDRFGQPVTVFTALLLALVGAGTVLATSVPPVALGLGVALATEALLIWREAAREQDTPTTVVLARPSWPLAVLALLVLAITLLLWLFVRGDAVRPYVFTGTFLSILLWAAYLPTTLLVWIADEDGLTRQWLSFKTCFRWQEIDWIYPARAKKTPTAIGLPVAMWAEETLIIEAGPARGAAVVLGAPLVRGRGRPLLDAIWQHARYAAFGFDQLPLVHERRVGGASARGAPTPTGHSDLTGAIR